MMGQISSVRLAHLDLLLVTALTAACKPAAAAAAASTSKGPSNSTVSSLKRTGSARFARLTSGGPGKS